MGRGRNSSRLSPVTVFCTGRFIQLETFFKLKTVTVGQIKSRNCLIFFSPFFNDQCLKELFREIAGNVTGFSENIEIILDQGCQTYRYDSLVEIYVSREE